MRLENLSRTIKHLRWSIQTPIEELIAWCINKYNVQPYGNCPVQAEGHLPSGEYYYFRSRWSSWSVRIAKTESALWNPSLNDDTWVYTEDKYEEFEAGWIGKLEVVKNFNKAVKLYHQDEHTRTRCDTTKVS